MAIIDFDLRLYPRTWTIITCHILVSCYNYYINKSIQPPILFFHQLFFYFYCTTCGLNHGSLQKCMDSHHACYSACASRGLCDRDWCPYMYIYIGMFVDKKKLNRTLAINSPFQIFTVGFLIEFIDYVALSLLSPEKRINQGFSYISVLCSHHSICKGDLYINGSSVELLSRFPRTRIYVYI